MCKLKSKVQIKCRDCPDKWSPGDMKYHSPTIIEQKEEAVGWDTRLSTNVSHVDNLGLLGFSIQNYF